MAGHSHKHHNNQEIRTMATMFHHDKRDYDKAKEAAAIDIRKTFHNRIQEGVARATKLARHLQSVVPEDRLAIHGRDLNFRWGVPERHAGAKAIQDPVLLDAADPEAKGMDGADDVGRLLDMVEVPNIKNDGKITTISEEDGTSRLLLDVGGHTVTLHNNALSQISNRTEFGTAGEKTKVPLRYLKQMMNSGEPALQRLCVDVLNTHYKDTPIKMKKSLVRSIDDEARGFLGSSYKRLDSMLLLETLLEAANDAGAVPTDAIMSDTRCQIKLVLQRVFEPIADSPMIFGVAWSTSDFGCGANCLALTIERLWCTNKATTMDSLREVHTGTKLHGDIAWSEDTREKVTAASAATMKDYIKHMLSDDNIGQLQIAIQKAHETETDWKKFGESIKRHLTKDELMLAENLFNNCEQEVLLPPARTVWRASNVLSLIAQSAKTAERTLELERMAGGVFESRNQKIQIAS